MRGSPSPPGARRASAPPLAPGALARAIGVSRVARVTGLDRTGVEVACAVRPGGHVLQVSNGKGTTWPEARAGALLEAAELACAERAPAGAVRWASPRELAGRGERLVPPAALPRSPGAPPADPREEAWRLAWREAEELLGGGRVLVPAAAVHVPPQGGPLLGAAPVRWTSNGMGAHRSRAAALLHALLEAVERDALARALPEGWTPEATRRRRAAAPRALAALVARLGRAGFEVGLFDLTPAPGTGGVALPVAGCLLRDLRPGPVPLAAGYACALDPASAARGALLEAAQSRLTDIHGAREDVGDAPVAEGEDGDGREELSREGEPHRPGPLLRSGRGDDGSERDGAEGAGPALRTVLSRLRAAGHATCAALDLAPPDLGVHVAKVVVPGLLLSELL